MADDEDEVIPETDDEFAEDEVLDPGELDEEDLDAEVLVVDEEFGEIDDDFVEEEEEDGEDDDTSGPVRRVVVGEEEDDDDETPAPDDVEADLDTILKDRMVAAEDDDDGEDEPEDRSETGDRLQPKRADERLCPSCFLLVRHGAPGCPVGDDDCPLFR